MLTGPFPAGITALTRLIMLYAPTSVRCQVRVGATAALVQVALRESIQRQRSLDHLRTQGAHVLVRAPSLTCPPGQDEQSLGCLSGLALSPGGLCTLRSCCRDLPGNRFEGQVPSSILAMRITEL
jgi:hypothetical protein